MDKDELDRCIAWSGWSPCPNEPCIYPKCKTIKPRPMDELVEVLDEMKEVGVSIDSEMLDVLKHHHL